MGKPKLIIMVGNIASGKTTWIKQNRMVKRDYMVLSKDALRRMLGAGKYVWNEDIEPLINSIIEDMLGSLMALNMNVIVDETNMDKITRRSPLHLTKKFHSLGYDYETIAVVMPFITEEHALERRCGLNDSAWGFSASTWRKVWRRKNSKFEMPTKKEGFDEILKEK